MEKIINKLINESTKGVDTYSHNGSTWLIFTESKQWVIELTESKTLWYNFNFFKNLFGYASLEVVQNQHLITKWVEDNIINKELTYVTLFRDARDRKQQFEDTLENGVKETKISPTHTEYGDWLDGDERLDEIIKNGIKETRPEHNITEGEVDDIIQDGVKKTKGVHMKTDWSVEEIIENGVRYTGTLNWNRDKVAKHALENGVKSSTPRQYVGKDIIEDIIEDGIIETYDVDWDVPTDLIENIIEDGNISTYEDVYHHTHRVEGVIKNGVKETKKLNEVVVDWIDDVIENGVKEIKPLPSQTGNKDWSEYSHGREDRTKPFNEYLNDTLEEGVKIN